MVKQATSKSNFKKNPKKKKEKNRFLFSNNTLKVLAYLLTHSDVTNCFVPPMAQPIKSKAPQTPQFPALSYQTEQPSGLLIYWSDVAPLVHHLSH
jgi:hypothetical protein